MNEDDEIDEIINRTIDSMFQNADFDELGDEFVQPIDILRDIRHGHTQLNPILSELGKPIPRDAPKLRRIK